MGTTRAICRLPVIVVVLVLLACAGFSAWGLYAWLWPKVESTFAFLTDKYDALVPEIIIHDGTATISAPQPYYVKTGDKDVAVVIDTRENKEKDALDYLKNVQAGAVLTRDSVVTKSQGQIRILPLKSVPNFVINSRNIKALFTRYEPIAVRLVILVLTLYFLVVKPLEAIIFALVPYLGARSYSVLLNYGEAIKIAVVAMIPSVTLDLFLDLSGIRIPMAIIIYFGLYLALLFLAVRDLVRNEPSPVGPSTSINP
ncbi:MAG: DUF1189 family protein [Desulfomonilaceae bacterium]